MTTPNVQADLNISQVPFPSSIGTQPSPWFTVANQFVPRTLHEVIKWSRYIIMQSPTTAEVIRKYCTYPITEFVVDSRNEKLQDKYKSIFDSFRLKNTLQDIGFEYFSIGNAFLSVFFPIQRTLICPSCNTGYNAKTNNFLTFKQYKFHGKCPKCGTLGYFKVLDARSTNIADMNVIKWDPEHIVVNHNPITGEYEYYYRIPSDIKMRIRKGDSLFVNSLPWEFIEAVEKNKDFKFDNDNLFHMRNLSTGAIVEGCCVPPLISLFNLVFYQATLRKANESIATEHMAPMRVLFPAPSSANADPIVSMSMRNFVENMKDAVIKHKKDNNYVLIAPGPVGYQAVGGEGKNLLVSQEIEQAEEAILMALGVSRELLSGQTNWTSSTVGLRLLTNTLRSYVTQITEVLNWIMRKVCAYIGLEYVKTSLIPFKLSDDDSLRNLLVTLYTSGLSNGRAEISQTTLYETMGLNFREELDKIRDDAVANATLQVETKYQVEEAQHIAAKDVEARLNRNTDYQTLLVQAQDISLQLMKEPPEVAQDALNQIKLSSYPLYVMVLKLIEDYQTNPVGQMQAEQEAAAGVAGQKGAPRSSEKSSPPAAK